MPKTEYVPMNIAGPYMNRSVPENQVQPGSFGDLVGVDNRYNGCLHKFFGMKEVVDIADDVTGDDTALTTIPTYDGISYFKPVSFHKKGTDDTIHGYVIRWDSHDDNNNEEVSLIYTINNGGAWACKTIWAGSSGDGNGIKSSLEMDCATDEGYLFVAIDTKSPKVLYWDTSMQVKDMGPGAYSAELVACALSGTGAVDSSYHLVGNGHYQVAWRFYDSTRGIYSALSAAVSFGLDHFKTTKATGGIYFSGRPADLDRISINSRSYEFDSNSTSSADVAIDISGTSSLTEDLIAMADAINADSSAVVTARAQSASVLLEATSRGSAGNAYTLVEDTDGGSVISLSNATLTGGGISTLEPETTVKQVLAFPADNAVISGVSDYDVFSVLFDKVEVFRTINMADVQTGGAIFYLEQTLSMPANEGLWDAPLTVTVGTIYDEALPFQMQYNPEIDTVTACPLSGTIGRYQNITFMGEAEATDGGYNTLFSSFEHTSGEYFSTYNKLNMDPEAGRPMRYIKAGDAMFILHPAAILHTYKTGNTLSNTVTPLQFTNLHQQQGLVGKGAAHAIGNSILLLTGLGLNILSATSGDLSQITSVDRILSDDWAGDLSTIESAYDARMGMSYFLHPGDSEMIAISMPTQSTSKIEGANFVSCGSGVDISTGKNIRAHFITKRGLIVVPDYAEDGYGNMWGINTSSIDLNGTTTTATAATIITDTSATFHADLVGALVYCTSGDNAGVARKITGVNVGTKTLTVSTFANAIATGTTFAIAPVPFAVRFWSLNSDDEATRLGEKFNRWNMKSVSLKCRAISGFSSNDNNFWRCGVFRNSTSAIEGDTVTIDVSTNPSDSAGYLNLDGIDVELYIEQIASGVSFELTNALVGVTMGDSKKVTA